MKRNLLFGLGIYAGSSYYFLRNPENLHAKKQKLQLQNGLPGRPWFMHSIYAPGYYTGYGVKTLPGIREAIENRKWDLAQQQIESAAKAIHSYTQQVEAANAVLMMK